jgi:hypothetical protein
MAKQRHQQPPPPQSKGPIALLVIGALLVAGLVVWALTRTVETSPTTAPDVAYTATTTPPTPTPTTSEAPIDVPPIASSTGGLMTTSQAPAPAPPQGDKSEVQRISAEDLREKVNAGSVTVVDVRDAMAYQADHIPGSLSIPMASIEANLDRLPKNREIVTYCT